MKAIEAYENVQNSIKEFEKILNEGFEKCIDKPSRRRIQHNIDVLHYMFQNYFNDIEKSDEFKIAAEIVDNIKHE